MFNICQNYHKPISNIFLYTNKFKIITYVKYDVYINSDSCSSRGFAKLCFGTPFLLFTLIFRIVGVALLITFLQIWSGVIIFILFFLNVLTALYIGDNFVRYKNYFAQYNFVQSNFSTTCITITPTFEIKFEITICYIHLGLLPMASGLCWSPWDTTETLPLTLVTKRCQWFWDIRTQSTRRNL